MIDPYVAIEQLIEIAQRKVDLHNAQPHNTKKITLADTIEAQSAEWISDYCRRFLRGDGKVHKHPLAIDLPPYEWRDMVRAYIDTERHDSRRMGKGETLWRKHYSECAKAILEDLEILEKRGRTQNLIARIPSPAMAAIERWQKARMASCETGIAHPEYMARLAELSNAEHDLMRIKT